MTTLETAPRASATGSASSMPSGRASANNSTATSPSSFNPPPKGFFSPAPTRATTAVDAGADNNGGGGGRNVNNSNRPRRESIGQMRRRTSDSATAAASAGGIGLAFANNGRGQPIPSDRRPGAIRGFSTSPRTGPTMANENPFSASLGSAAEAISLPASVLNSGAKSGRSTGHYHFGQECFGPEPDEPAIPNPPASLTKAGALSVSANDGSTASSALLAAAAAARRGSIAESSNAGDDDDAPSVSGGGGGGRSGKELPIHRCESCNKVYRHPSCLVKHRWEHTVHWKEASKFLMSKHQQVQLLEAAAILVNMDGDTASLPDEKALWPAAVSPATSGLLGSDKVNFDKMMQRKVARRGRSSSSATANSDFDAASTVGGARASSLSRSSSAGMSPLNSFSKLGLSNAPAHGGGNASRPSLGHSYSNSFTPYSYGSLGTSHRLNSDIQHLVLDESDERTTTTGTETSSDDRTDSRDRSGSAETTEDDEEEEDGQGDGEAKEKKWGLHEDALAEMDMDDE